MPRDENKAGGLTHLSGRCEDVQPMLFDFVSHELGDARAEVARRHLVRCPTCRAQAAELRRTIVALRQAAAPDDQLAQRVTDDRRAQLLWSITHPVQDWIHRHHLFVAVVVALISIAVLLAVLHRIDPRVRVEPPEEGIEVIIQGKPAPGPHISR